METGTGTEGNGDTDVSGASARRATIEDVATGAGVSVATVSRALRGLPNVAAATRSRVAAVADKLRYRPDPAAARLAAGRTMTVTIGVPELNSWYFSTVVAGAEAVCKEAGYEFQVVGVTSRADRDRLLDDENFLERRTDGLILVDVEPTAEQARSLERRNVALATVGWAVSGHPNVRIDDERVGRLAAEHLLELGHRRFGIIGWLNVDPQNVATPAARERGLTRALADHDLTVAPDLIAHRPFGVDGGRDAMSALLDASTPPTAVFALSDEMAFGALMELRARGVRVGHDVSLIGVDDHEFSRVVDLTTVRQPVGEHGAVAARLLLESIVRNHTDTADSSDATTRDAASFEARIEVVVRNTTGNAPMCAPA